MSTRRVWHHRAGQAARVLAPLSHEDARDAFEGMIAEVERGRRLLLAASANGELVGTVQVILAMPSSQPTARRSPSCSFDPFTILQMVADKAGVISAVDVSFTQHCESATAPALTGRIAVRATE